jgi:hypothetical protein
MLLARLAPVLAACLLTAPSLAAGPLTAAVLAEAHALRERVLAHDVVTGIGIITAAAPTWGSCASWACR